MYLRVHLSTLRWRYRVWTSSLTHHPRPSLLVPGSVDRLRGYSKTLDTHRVKVEVKWWTLT